MLIAISKLLPRALHIFKVFPIWPSTRSAQWNCTRRWGLSAWMPSYLQPTHAPTWGCNASLLSQALPWHCPTESQGSERISGDHLIQPPLLKQVPYPGMHPMTLSSACPPHCSLTYPTPAQLTSKDVLGDSIKALLKSRYTTPTALPFTSSHGITEGYQIDQAWFSPWWIDADYSW